MGRVRMPGGGPANLSLRIVIGTALLLAGAFVYRLGEIAFLVTGSGDLFSLAGVVVAGIGAAVALRAGYRLLRRVETGKA